MAVKFLRREIWIKSFVKHAETDSEQAITFLPSYLDATRNAKQEMGWLCKCQSLRQVQEEKCISVSTKVEHDLGVMEIFLAFWDDRLSIV